MAHITLRKPETEEKYQKWLKEPKDQPCCFCRELEKFYRGEAKKKPVIIEQWAGWGLMKNDFPYDAFFRTHHLLFSLRHVDWDDLTVKERNEYEVILKKLEPKYHVFIRNLGHRISQKSHAHVHLLNYL